MQKILKYSIRGSKVRRPRFLSAGMLVCEQDVFKWSAVPDQWEIHVSRNSVANFSNFC